MTRRDHPSRPSSGASVSPGTQMTAAASARGTEPEWDRHMLPRKYVQMTEILGARQARRGTPTQGIYIYITDQDCCKAAKYALA
jgi:hypothetical protein